LFQHPITDRQKKPVTIRLPAEDIQRSRSSSDIFGRVAISQKLIHIADGKRFGEVESLTGLAAKKLEFADLIRVFNAFGDRFEIKRITHHDDRFGDSIPLAALT
jgi:hypothetical protein